MAIPGNEPFTGAKDGKPAGLIAEATADVLKAMGREVNLRNLPFKRMYKWVHEGKVDVAISVLKTPDRAKLALYTDPVITEYTVIMVPAGKVFKLNKVADLKDRRIGGQLGFRYPPLDGVGVKLIRERNYQTNIAKIASGKIEGILIGSVTGQYLVKNLGYTGQVEILPKAIGSVGLGAALSKAKFSDADLAAFNKELAALKKSPRWAEILTANGLTQFVQRWPVLN